MSATKRYSNEELELFKSHIEHKLGKTNKDLDFLLGQIEDISESKGNGGDWIDDTSSNNDLEMLYAMANRNRHYIRDLENALIRISHKTYGICVITGELIDKRRLMAVPTTTKSLAAKNAIVRVEEKKERKSPLIFKNGQQKTITKIVRKASTQTKSIKFQEEEGEEFDDEFFDDEFFDSITFDDTENALDKLTK